MGLLGLSVPSPPAHPSHEAKSLETLWKESVNTSSAPTFWGCKLKGWSLNHPPMEADGAQHL